MRQLLETVHLFPSSPPENIFDAKIHLYVQKKKTFQLSGLQTNEAALKKNGLNCLHIIYTNVKHTYFTEITTQTSDWESCRAGRAQDEAPGRRKELTYCALAALCVCNGV